MKLYWRLDDDGKTPVPCSLEEWAQHREDVDRCRVQYTQLSNGEVRVSTVFLGLDHGWGEGPPVLFETMIFGGKADCYQDRTCTWEEAMAAHDRAVNHARELLK